MPFRVIFFIVFERIQKHRWVIAVAVFLTGCMLNLSSCESKTPTTTTQNPAETIIAWLDSTQLIQKSYYASLDQLPERKVVFVEDNMDSQGAEADKKLIQSFRYIDINVDVYTANMDGDSEAEYIAVVNPPMPMSSYLMLAFDENLQFLDQYAWSYKYGMHDAPSWSFEKLIDEQEDLQIISDDGVLCRYSQTLTLVRLIDGKWEEILNERIWSDEGGCYRGSGQNDSLGIPLSKRTGNPDSSIRGSTARYAFR